MSARKAKAPQRSPRRKAGRATARKAKRVIRFRLTVEAQEMNVSFTPNYFEGQGHFEFRSPFDPPRRIPISVTGYRSHFAPMEEIEAADSPQAYARETVLCYLRVADPRSAACDDRQLPLF